MKIALAQLSAHINIEKNFQKAVEAINVCAKQSCDLIMFPEIHLSQFFPKYSGYNAKPFAMDIDSEYIRGFRTACAQNNIMASINIYLLENGKYYDASVLINGSGEILDISKMVHIASFPDFYEREYYAPSDTGFKVVTTPFGKIGTVICFDRHFPESIRTCALKGAELILIPTANMISEPLEMFEDEIRVQAMQNSVFIAMCNRVGNEDGSVFAGDSIVVNPKGDVIARGGDIEEYLTCEIDLTESTMVRDSLPYFKSRRPEMYMF